jgi:hypothetical protein
LQKILSIRDLLKSRAPCFEKMETSITQVFFGKLGAPLKPEEGGTGGSCTVSR